MSTGSVSPILNDKIPESGFGHWKMIHVLTLSFYEYCELVGIAVPELPTDVKPMQMYLRPLQEQTEIFNKRSGLQVSFIRYLQVGGKELTLSADD